MGFLSLRSRLLQSLILALLGLTFYTYYRTTASEIQQYAFARGYGRSSLYDSAHSQQPQQQQQQPNNTSNNNSISETSAALSTARSRPNASELLPPALLVNGSLPRNVATSSNSSTVITVISAASSSSSQVSSSTSTTTTTTSTTVAPPTAPVVVDKNSARAIYAPGHSVGVADKCPEQGRYMDLVIVIMSAPTHFEARTAIRQTWGHFGQRRDIGIVFMLGATSNPKFERSLEREQDMYGDIVRGNFVDSYFNLTLKTISTLEWVDTYCSEVKFVLKTDDDMFINVPRLVSFINKHRKDKNVIFGKVARKWKPVRNKSSKYFVSLAQYKSVFYPDFCTGPAYLMSNDVIHNLHDAALNETFLKLEDVFVTGIVASKLGVKRVHANEFLNRKISYSPCNVQRGISIHMVKYSEQFDLWKKLLDGKVKCK